MCVHVCVCVYTYICHFFLHFSRNRGEWVLVNNTNTGTE